MTLSRNSYSDFTVVIWRCCWCQWWNIEHNLLCVQCNRHRVD